MQELKKKKAILFLDKRRDVGELTILTPSLLLHLVPVCAMASLRTICSGPLGN